MPATLSQFTSSRPLTIKTGATGASLGGSLSNFPVCVVINSTTWTSSSDRSRFFSGNNNTAGKRVQFFASDGTTNLPYEVEKFTADTEAIYWVKVPSLSVSDSANVIYVGFGNDPNGSNQDQATSVWDSSFVGVWHLNSSLADSTSNTNNLTDVGTVGYLAGNTGNALDLPGTSAKWAYVRTDTNTELRTTGQCTYEAWANPDAIAGYLINNEGRGAWADGRGAGLYLINATSKLGFKLGDGSGSWRAVSGTATISTGAWRHLVGRYDNANFKLFVDGALDATNAWSNGTWSWDRGTGNYPDPSTLYIAGDHNNGGTGNTDTANMSGWFDGRIEEVRISNVARSDDWLKATYYSMKQTSWPGDGWLAWGTTVTSGTASVTSNAVLKLPVTEAPLNRSISGKVDVDDFSTYRRFDAVNSGTVTRTSNSIQVTAANTNDYHGRRSVSYTRFDTETPTEPVTGLQIGNEISICFDVLANNANCDYSGVISLVSSADSTDRYTLRVAKTAGGTSTLQRVENGTPAQIASATKGVDAGVTKRVKLWKRNNQFGAVVDGVAMTPYTDSAELITNANYWLGIGAPATSGTSDNRYDNLAVCYGVDILFRGLSSGQSVRLYNSSDTVVASATESGGVATLDCADLMFPFTGYFRLFTDNTYTTEVARWPEESNATEIYGGDTYNLNLRQQTNVSVLGSDLQQFYATQQHGSRAGIITNSDGSLMFGAVMGYKGELLTYIHDLSSHRTQFVDMGVRLVDHHNPIGFVADSSGYLHLVYGGGKFDSSPTYHRISTNPWDISSWGAPAQVSAGFNGNGSLGAYVLLIDQADTLHLIGGNVSTTDGYGYTTEAVYHTKRPSGGSWGTPNKLIQGASGALGYANHWELYITDVQLGKEASGQKSLHFTLYTYENNLSLWKHCFYMRSLDGGTTWQGINGSTATLPITQNTTTGVFSGGGTMVVNGDSYGQRFTVAADRTVHLVAGASGTSTATYYRGTHNGSFSNPNGKTFSDIRTQSPLGTLMNDTSLVFVATQGAGYPWHLERHLSFDNGNTWRQDRMFDGSIVDGQWYWPIMVSVQGQDYFKVVWQSRKTGYNGRGAHYEGTATLLTADVKAVISTTTTSDALLCKRNITTTTSDAILLKEIIYVESSIINSAIVLSGIDGLIERWTDPFNNTTLDPDWIDYGSAIVGGGTVTFDNDATRYVSALESGEIIVNTNTLYPYTNEVVFGVDLWNNTYVSLGKTDFFEWHSVDDLGNTTHSGYTLEEYTWFRIGISSGLIRIQGSFDGLSWTTLDQFTSSNSTWTQPGVFGIKVGGTDLLSLKGAAYVAYDANTPPELLAWDETGSINSTITVSGETNDETGSLDSSITLSGSDTYSTATTYIESTIIDVASIVSGADGYEAGFIEAGTLDVVSTSSGVDSYNVFDESGLINSSIIVSGADAFYSTSYTFEEFGSINQVSTASSADDYIIYIPEFYDELGSLGALSALSGEDHFGDSRPVNLEAVIGVTGQFSASRRLATRIKRHFLRG